MKFIKPFMVGDLVQYVGNTDRHWEPYSLLVITDTFCCDVNEYEYLTTSGAWFSHSDLALVDSCCEQTMSVLLEVRRQEEAGIFDYDGEWE